MGKLDHEDNELTRRLREGVVYYGLGNFEREEIIMDTNGARPLKPLDGGIILIVGVKQSNLAEELRNHPRIVTWDSQQKSWSDKDLPSNTRAVFLTRFIGHNEFDVIISQARKRHITVFNPEGTGMIAKQVKELLNINQPKPELKQEAKMSVNEMKGKLEPLYHMIDFSKGNTENARFLVVKAKEMGISTTMMSLVQMVSARRRKMNMPKLPQGPKTPKRMQEKTTDVSVEILDGMIKELQDMRDFIIATVEENKALKGKLETLKKLFS